MDRLTRHPLLKDIPFETAVDYAQDFILIVGVPLVFEEKVEEIQIKDYRGTLPCDYYEMILVRLPKGPCFRYTTDSFHLSNHKPIKGDYTYKIQNNIIFTSIKEGIIEISYRAIAVDDEGYPLLPDKTSFLRALELYIKLQWFTIKFDEGKIDARIILKTEQEYCWAVGQCLTDLIKPSIDQLESFSNMWNTLHTRIEHNSGFLNEGTQEHLKLH